VLDFPDDENELKIADLVHPVFFKFCEETGMGSIVIEFSPLGAYRFFSVIIHWTQKSDHWFNRPHRHTCQKPPDTTCRSRIYFTEIADFAGLLTPAAGNNWKWSDLRLLHPADFEFRRPCARCSAWKRDRLQFPLASQ